METNWAELFTAVFSSRKFNNFFGGVDFVLPDGKKTNIKIDSYQKKSRLEGYRLSKYSFKKASVFG